jgi:3alpha(or 20beta)-hydroxysteroid dehydrogenase
MSAGSAARLAGRTALVTGGARGLGEGIVRQLIADGAHVIVGDVREELGQALATELGGQASFQKLDVTDERDWSSAVGATVDVHGGLDVLVNNAGRGGPTPIGDTTLEQFRRIVDVNQVGTFLGMRACAPVMVRQGRGTIVNIASIEGIRGLAGFAAYCGAKHAVVGMTRAVSLELARTGVRVNSVCPGAVQTPGLAHGIGGDARMVKLASTIPQGRLAAAGEIAVLVAFLASDDGSYCTGGEFVVDGGWTAGNV